MTLKDGKIDRLVDFLSCEAYDAADPVNTFKYHRAPDGYLFVLHSMQISTNKQNNASYGIAYIYDGHEYTNWNQWPGVESRELLGRIEYDAELLDFVLPLNMWECKEFTLGVRSSSVSYATKCCFIVWFYLKKASRKELLEYAVKHPMRHDTFKAAMGPTTLDEDED